MAKKILASILAICLVLSTMSFSVFAAGDSDADNAVAQLGEQYYSSVSLAIEDAEAGDIIYVLKDIETIGDITKPVVIEGKLNGVEGAKVTLSGNAGEHQFGEINGTVTIKNFIYENGNEAVRTDYDSYDYENLNLVISNCDFKNISNYCIMGGSSGNNHALGSLTVTYCTFTASDASFTSNYMVYAQCVKKVTITKSIFDGKGCFRGAVHLGDSTEYGTNATVSENTIKNFSRGVQVGNRAADGNSITISKNIFENIVPCSGDSKTAEECGPVFVHTNADAETFKKFLYMANETTACNDVTIAYETADDAEAFEDKVVYSDATEVATKAELDAAIAAANEGDIIRLADNIDYTGTASLEINKAITLDLGGYTLTTNGTYGGLRLMGNCSLKNGTLAHKGTVTAIKAWNIASIEDVVIDVAYKEGKTIGGIVIQNVATNRIGTIKNVTIQGEGLTNGIETYNCGNATENVIGSMENVTIDAKGTGMLISAPCGTATNCVISGDVSGIELWIKGTYSATLDLENCKVNGGNQAVYIHDEFSSNPSIVNNGTLQLTTDDDTTYASDKGALLTKTIARAENVDISDVEDVVLASSTAKIGDTYYTTLANAMNAATDGETITVLNNITLDGVNNGVWIDGLYYTGDKSFTVDFNGYTVTGGTAINDYVIYLKNMGNAANEITFTNGTIIAETTKVFATITVGAASAKYPTTLNLNGMTVENNTAVNGDDVVRARSGSVVNVNSGSTLTSDGASSVVNATTGNSIINVNSGATLIQKNSGTLGGNNVYTAITGLGTVNVYDGAAVISDRYGVYMSTSGNAVTNIYGGTITAEIALAAVTNGGEGQSVTINVTGGAINGTLKEANADCSIVVKGGTFSSDPSAYVVEGYQVSRTSSGYEVLDETMVVDTINVLLDNKTVNAKEGYVTYDIVLNGDGDTINRLNSAELTFALSNAKMAYEVTPAENISIQNGDSYDHYMFYFKGKTNVTNDSGVTVKIGTIKVTGYGEYELSVNAEGTNVAHATTVSDNLVDTFVPNPDSEIEGTLNLPVAENGKIEVPKRTLTVNVDFPNVVVDNAADYQSMTVTISGGDLAEDIVEELGNGTNTNASYTVEADLTLNTAYTVTVSGAGYRTARYTVTMTDVKTLNFWNNVKDNTVEVEEGKASSAVVKNFLAGDIVADNNINIYDLSAVVSYFTQSAKANADYIKYDLNRDGIIDSKDVAYVLVSWGE